MRASDPVPSCYGESCDELPKMIFKANGLGAEVCNRYKGGAIPRKRQSFHFDCFK